MVYFPISQGNCCPTVSGISRPIAAKLENVTHLKVNLSVLCCNVSTMVDLQGKMRGKKLQSLVDRISPQVDLGPYAGGSYCPGSGQSVKLELVTLGRLQAGLNAERVVVGRAVCSVSTESSVTLYVAIQLSSHSLSKLVSCEFI